MSRTKSTANKAVVAILVVLIVALAIVAVVPAVYSLIMGPGLRTDGIHADNAKPASTQLDGQWDVTSLPSSNTTSVGFTFWELLPAERKETSGSTQSVSGQVNIDGETLTSAEIVVDMADISTDNARRDNNVRSKILSTNQYPTATFSVTKPVNLADIPEDGTVGSATLTGDLEVRGVSREISHEFEVLRTGANIIVAGDIEINRHDYGVESPDFVAAKIDEVGQLNIRIALEKK